MYRDLLPGTSKMLYKRAWNNHSHLVLPGGSYDTDLCKTGTRYLVLEFACRLYPRLDVVDALVPGSRLRSVPVCRVFSLVATVQNMIPTRYQVPTTVSVRIIVQARTILTAQMHIIYTGMYVDSKIYQYTLYTP